jgi:hypothetical protein
MLPFLVVGLILNVAYPAVFDVGGPPPALLMASFAVLAVGTVIWAWSVVLVGTRVPRGELITSGPYALVKLIPVDAGTPAGTPVTLWTGANGEPVEAPLRHDQVTGRAAVAGALAMSAAITLAGIARMVLGRLLDRHRLAAWQAEWSTVGPAWTGRR